MKIRSIIAACALVACNFTVAHAQSADDLKFSLRPNYLSPAAADAADANAPLATPEEEKAFHHDCDALLENAGQLAPKDRVALYQSLELRAAKEKSAGGQRLLMLAAFHQALRWAPSPADLDTAAQAALDVLDGATIALAGERVDLLRQTHELLPQNPQYAPSQIADEMFTLAELQFDAGLFGDAVSELTPAQRWADRDPDYAARMKPFVDRFAAEVQRQADAEKALLQHPEDAHANATVGLSHLGRSANPAEAAPFLAKSANPRLQRLAKALAVKKPDASDRMEIAAAALDSLKEAAEPDQISLACLVRLEVTLAAANSAGDQTGKQVYMDQARKILAGFAWPPENIGRRAVQLYGLPARCHAVVFILDHSGSMLDNFDFLRQETIHAVNRMTPVQRFNVIMVSEVTDEVFPELQQATPAAKKDFEKKLSEFRAQGQNDDLLAPFQEAFEKAFAMKPDTIYFLTDGHFDPQLASVVEKLNDARKVHINTLAFINQEPSYQEQLKNLAKNNGGQYRFVTEKDLGQ